MGWRGRGGEEGDARRDTEVAHVKPREWVRRGRCREREEVEGGRGGGGGLEVVTPTSSEPDGDSSVVSVIDLAGVNDPASAR